MTTGAVILIVAGVALVLVLMYLIGIYNRLVSLKNRLRTPSRRSTCS